MHAFATNAVGFLGVVPVLEHVHRNAAECTYAVLAEFLCNLERLLLCSFVNVARVEHRVHTIDRRDAVYPQWHVLWVHHSRANATWAVERGDERAVNVITVP